ncbi:uncharacterized protein N7483_012803 [Penicillium malachiteum]|uniref:uncharacterized protein n=1 Tax=Penicillium malachiteum TaxID=1324776 RepID=UPI0025486F74|nr:uncharacterized protein N7483_012803 [Penicillium malachiteum]KAJ5715622.1 hypothetical protein N7483_012803 [Penicillium malachiteum]
MSRMWVSFIVDQDPNYSDVSMYFNVNMTNVLAVEPDYYRAAGIAYIQDCLVPLYGSASEEILANSQMGLLERD